MRKRLRQAGTTTAVVALLVLGGARCGDNGGETAPVLALDGVDGVLPGMYVDAVEERWGPLRLREVFLGSDSDAYAPLCVRGMRGWLHFYGPNGGPFWLKEIHFVAGARTDTGIRIGSTRAEVRRAYGSRLVLRKPSGSLMLLGRRRVSQDARDIIVFVFKDDVVDQVVFGFRNEITEGRRTSDGRTVVCS